MQADSSVETPADIPEDRQASQQARNMLCRRGRAAQGYMLCAAHRSLNTLSRLILPSSDRMVVCQQQVGVAAM